MKIAVLGLGEAGSTISHDLAIRDCEVFGFDPAPVNTPAGVVRSATAAEAVRNAGIVLTMTASSDAEVALSQALAKIPEGTIYADCSTSALQLKRDLCRTATEAGLNFVDVALMKPVPGLGLRTPALASGPGVIEFVATMQPLGMPVENVGPEPGAAATRKLLRSIVIKGLTALVIESMEAANEVGLGNEVWENLADQLDEQLIRRLIAGTELHGARRLHEMQAVEQLLNELGTAATMTAGTVQSLKRVATHGLPRIPDDNQRRERSSE